ncbi:MAG: quinolinate synthase [Methanofollis sp.]|nr:quinolinate synthase [Methanofollis sp.]
MMQTQLAEEIARLKEEKNAVILAHNYQIPEVQDVADLVGDSLELARAATAFDADVIVFCGVDFMAQTAAILSPERRVVLPAGDACCPMAGMITAGEVRVLKERYPDAAVVCYVNTTAGVKAESDICCTSANAVKVVGSLEEERIIFVPDRNLAGYVARFTKKEILPWEGFCYVHDLFTPEEVAEARRLHPGAEVLVHPECRPGVIDRADAVLSTSGMVRHACASRARSFVIGTETGILHQLRKKSPDREFYPLSARAICTNMKKTNLAGVGRALLTLESQVTVPTDIADRARSAIERMLAVS